MSGVFSLCSLLTKLSYKIREIQLSEVCGKQLTGEDLYLAPNSTKRNRKSELSSNNKIKLCNKLSC